jgi:hypothetical protein
MLNVHVTADAREISSIKVPLKTCLGYVVVLHCKSYQVHPFMGWKKVVFFLLLVEVVEAHKISLVLVLQFDVAFGKSLLASAYTVVRLSFSIR